MCPPIFFEENMEFYTSIQSLGDDILVRSYENGERISYREKFNPTLFVPDNKGKMKFKTIHGNPVSKVNPGTIHECREFIESYKDVEKNHRCWFRNTRC